MNCFLGLDVRQVLGTTLESTAADGACCADDEDDDEDEAEEQPDEVDVRDAGTTKEDDCETVVVLVDDVLARFPSDILRRSSS